MTLNSFFPSTRDMSSLRQFRIKNSIGQGLTLAPPMTTSMITILSTGPQGTMSTGREMVGATGWQTISQIVPKCLKPNLWLSTKNHAALFMKSLAKKNIFKVSVKSIWDQRSVENVSQSMKLNVQDMKEHKTKVKEMVFFCKSLSQFKCRDLSTQKWDSLPDKLCDNFRENMWYLIWKGLQNKISGKHKSTNFYQLFE